MATIIDIYGITHTIHPQIKSKLHIVNNSTVKEIIKLEPTILDVKIDNNIHLDTIQLNKRGLRMLSVTNNPLLRHVNAIPITMSVIIKDNPLLDYDTLLLDFTSFPSFESYLPHIEIVKPIIKCNNSLSVDNIQFINNSDSYQTSPHYFNNNNKYIIHNEYYDGVAYPIITLPKGLLLYTYTYIKPEIDIISNIYNINEYKNYENEMKFFYSVPYGAKFGIDGKYNHCNIVVLTSDIRLLCLLTPAPQNMEMMMFPNKNGVSDNAGKQCILYNSDTTHPCDLYDHDLCLSVDFRSTMNLQGYINIDIDDSMSNSDAWKKAYGNATYADIIKEYLNGSCISSAKIDKSNYRYINNIYSMRMPPNTVFGLPQIALCPIKTHLYNESHDYIYNKLIASQRPKKHSMEKFIFENFNYYMVDSCSIDNISNTLNKFKTDVVQNKQYHLFYLLNTYKDPEYIHWKNIEPISAEDVDYLFTYTNNIVGCAFETIAYKLKSGGGSRKRKTGTRKHKHTKNDCPFIFARTDFGMPIMYRK